LQYEVNMLIRNPWNITPMLRCIKGHKQCVFLTSVSCHSEILITKNVTTEFVNKLLNVSSITADGMTE